VSTIDRLAPEEITQVDDDNRAIWARVAATYADGFEDLTGEAAQATLDAAGVGRGTRVLDVGTGPGTLIGPALERGATVQAIDLTDDMVGVARRRFPEVEIVTGKASDLPFDDRSMDAVTLGFCLHHMAEPARALAEANRVLRPAGRIAFTVWADLEALEAFALPYAALAELGLGGEEAGPEPPLPLGRPLEEYEAALEQAGFEQPMARRLDVGWRMRGGAGLVDGFDRLFDLPRTATADQRASFAAAVERAVAERAAADGTTYFANPAILATARSRG
jgi:SAM-dependent methyltransferase